MTQSQDWNKLRNGIMGFGEVHSTHKMYYPELQKKLNELNRYKALFDNISDIIIHIDINNNQIIEANNSAAGFLNYSKDEILKCDILSVLEKSIYENIRVKSYSFYNERKDLLFNTFLMTKDENKIPVEMICHYQEHESNLICILICRNIEERVHAEQLHLQTESSLRSVFDNTYDAIIIHNFDGKIYEVNSQMLHLFKIEKKDIKKYTLFDFTASSKENETLLLHIQNAVNGNSTIFEWVSKKPFDSTAFDSEIAMKKVNWYGQEMILTIIRDITKRKTLEENLKQINIELENRVKSRTIQLENTLSDLRKEIQIRTEIEKHLVNTQKELASSLEKEKEVNILKSQFVSMVSHEYRTPLTVILSSTYLLDIYYKHQKEAEFQKHLLQIQTSVQDMTKMLEDVISIGKISSGKKEFEITEFNLTTLIKDTISIASSNSYNSHKFIFNFNNLEYEIQTDYRLLTHCIINVLSNAVKFSPKGSNIYIDLYAEEQFYVLKIRDEGIGIEDTEIKNIFEPFFRAKNIGNIAGTGLGLAIVKNSISIIKGRISVDSKIDYGTTVTIKIPQVLKD